MVSLLDTFYDDIADFYHLFFDDKLGCCRKTSGYSSKITFAPSFFIALSPKG
jgi:hypothetical protein